MESTLSNEKTTMDRVWRVLDLLWAAGLSACVACGFVLAATTPDQEASVGTITDVQPYDCGSKGGMGRCARVTTEQGAFVVYASTTFQLGEAVILKRRGLERFTLCNTEGCIKATVLDVYGTARDAFQ